MRGQKEYLAFWEELIRTRIKAVRFNKNWECSSGCTFEFVAASLTEIPTFDAEGREINYKTALQGIEAAITRFQGFDTKKLQENLERLKKIRIKLAELGSTMKTLS